MAADDTGTEFANLDLAYLDAYRAAGEMWLDMSRQGLDPSLHCFEITDDLGRLLMEVPFSEVLQTAPRGRLRARAPVTKDVCDVTARSQSLAAEIASLVERAQKNLQETRSVLDRLGQRTP